MSAKDKPVSLLQIATDWGWDRITIAQLREELAKKNSEIKRLKEELEGKK